MSLLINAMTPFAVLRETETADGYGAYASVFIQGSRFLAAIVKDNTSAVSVGEASEPRATFTVTTAKDVVLHYHDKIKRLSDGQIFIITSNGEDKATPDTSSLNMRQVSAEEWRVPDVQ